MRAGTASQGAGDVELVGLTRHFGAVVAVDAISLKIASGEFVTLLGPSGSGKTTTLMMIAGFVKPTAGEIYIGGQSVTRTPPFKRNVGMVFQNYALFPHMTVFENIAFPLEMRKLPRGEIEDRVKGALGLVKLSGYESRYPRQLSGGQQQRIALARALVFNPLVLLMDEPLGALDKKLREHMQLELKHLQEALEVTVIYVTHDQEEALVMSDRIAVMNLGRIEQVGSPDRLYREPANDFVAQFLGESNLLDATVVARRDDGWVAETAKKLRLLLDPHEDLVVGRQVRVTLRPENIVLDDGAGLPNTYAGTVEELIYIGGYTKFTVRLADTDEILTFVRLNSTGLPEIRRGNRVTVGWHAGDARVVLSADAAAAPAERPWP